MQIRCPHCQEPFEVIDESSLSDVHCASCGSNFDLVEGETVSYEQPDQAISHFKLVAKLGTGAFGTVWKAKDTKLDRFVALKCPRKEQLSAEEQEQFIREARAASQLKHQSIVSVHEVGRENDQLFIVSEYVEGVTLADWLTSEQLSCREAAQLCQKIADAVQHAHDKGVIHRDLKPSNVILDSDGEPHVMDFGLAKREAGEITMTVEGQILGTPAYMSPEQAGGFGHNADRRSDVYSIGVILFEALTGELPFRGNFRMLLHHVVNTDAPSPRQLNNNVQRDLETICLNCLHKDPDRRFATAGELSADLQRWLDGEAIQARPVGRLEKAWLWCRRHPWPVVTVAVMLLAALVVAVVLRVSNARNEQLRLETIVSTLADSKGTAVPILLGSLDDFSHQQSHAEIRSQFPDASKVGKQSLLYGLAHYGDVRVADLVDELISEDADPDEVMNIVNALANLKSGALTQLKVIAEQLTEQEAWLANVRVAIVAMHLGDASIAVEMLRGEPEQVGPFDPIQRTRFVSEFPEWCGDAAALTDLAKATDDVHFRSGICLALGGIARPSESTRTAWEELLAEWHATKPDSGTHGATRWALRQWGVSLPVLNATKEPLNQQNWWRTPSGLTMIRIPSGTVAGEKGPVRVDQDFWLCDQEASIPLFMQFIEDTGYQGPSPEDWDKEVEGVGTEKVIHSISRYDALKFCNWLSEREGRKPCYEIVGNEKLQDEYEVSFLADGTGYRLPTEAQWEYACRAMTTTSFSFGDSESDLEDYGSYTGNSNLGASLAGTRRCNAWGLFDMHGNMWEWCWDSNESRSAKLVYRGGSWHNFAQFCVSSFGRRDPTNRIDNNGFRLALVPSSSSTQDEEPIRESKEAGRP